MLKPMGAETVNRLPGQNQCNLYRFWQDSAYCGGQNCYFVALKHNNNG